MSEDLVSFEVNGIPLQAPRGSMLIRATDAAGIRIPRFCFHDKLSVAANCRMCLVEVENAPKPMPACALPVAEGMKVYTQSPKAVSGQKATMEFLLINHPLDCPICDQGGECELQDVAMGYGEDVSRYSEAKRVVKDKDIGPLISTEMTRCIHCTRCVRFGEEVAGMRELGATGRGENMEIGTFIAKSVVSELSGNVIDLCPVGALTAKPSRFTYRSWELMQHATVAPHDGVGANIFLHSYNKNIMRVVPRHNEAVNETWIADRDRFSYTALGAADRLTRPMIRDNGQWLETDWQTALTRVVERLRGCAPEQVGALLSPSSTLEEFYLAQSWLRGLGIQQIDHRLRQTDFSDQHLAPLFPWLGASIESVERAGSCLLIGSNIRKDQPMLAHRLRKAALAGAVVMSLDVRDYDFHFPLAGQSLNTPQGMLQRLASLVKAALGRKKAPEQLAGLLTDAKADAEAKAWVAHLKKQTPAHIFLGVQAHTQAHFAELRALAALLAELTGAQLGYLPEGGNAAGAWLAGAIPHRFAAGVENKKPGSTPDQWLRPGLQACFLFNVEPHLDYANAPAAVAALKDAFVVAASTFADDELKAVADVLLPIASFAETGGTYVNLEGRWQSVKGAVPPPGEARPGWKVFRVLGNMSGLKDFEQVSVEQVRDTIKAELAAAGIDGFDNALNFDAVQPREIDSHAGLQQVSAVGMYAVDGLLRRAGPLQHTEETVGNRSLRMHPDDAKPLGLEAGQTVQLERDGQSVQLPVSLDPGMALGCIWVPVGIRQTAALGGLCGPLTVSKV